MFSTFLQWLDERTGLPTVLGTIAGAKVPPGRNVFRFLPAMIVFAFVLQAISGIFLWAFYSPSAQSAWESLFYLQFSLPGGWLIRGVHHFSGQVLVALLGIYIALLVLRGGYRSPREFVFWTAVVLLLFALASSLTGDLLSWSLSGYSATLVRVRFLQMLPVVGDPLFRIVAGGPEFGTLTLPRFLVLHILVFGGGFFAVMLLWRFFEHRADRIVGDDEAAKPVRFVPFWSNEILKCSLAWFFVAAIVLFLNYQKPINENVLPKGILEKLPSGMRYDDQLPRRESSLGVHLGAPADPADFYDAARPEWSFRALYHFSNLFSGDLKILPIFVIPGCLAFYVFLIPIIGHFKLGRVGIGHYFNVMVMLFLFGAFCYLTFASYHHDYNNTTDESKKFLVAEAGAETSAKRSIELCLSPNGIPPTGALTLLKSDPLLQGPVLYERHCISCHPFKPLVVKWEEDKENNVKKPVFEPEHSDFEPFVCENPSAPNLYVPIRKEWIGGFLDSKKIRSDDYFGKTKFGNGTMVDWVRGTLGEILKEDDENEELLDQLVDFLAAEAIKDVPRSDAEPVSVEQVNLFATFDCGQCHFVYGLRSAPVIQAPDLRGYLSRDWMIAIIADPTTKRFYGPDVGKKGNDRMPAFHRSKDDSVMSLAEIETLVDWLRGKWYRLNDE